MPKRIESRLSNRFLDIHAYSSIIHSIPKVEATKVIIFRLADTQRMVILIMECCLALNRKKILTYATT
jgi:hypothetical protein